MTQVQVKRSPKQRDLDELEDERDYGDPAIAAAKAAKRRQEGK